MLIIFSNFLFISKSILHYVVNIKLILTLFFSAGRRNFVSRVVVNKN